MVRTKIVLADLDSSCRELSVRGLKYAIALPFWGGVDFFVCVYWKSNPTVSKYIRRRSKGDPVNTQTGYQCKNSQGENQKDPNTQGK